MATGKALYDQLNARVVNAVGGRTHLGEGIEDIDEGGGTGRELGLLERIHHALDG